MLIVPELRVVVILTPRTGTGSLRRAIQARYPRAMLLYRHMEADGVPMGYDRWEKLGVVREPVERLWSLYKFFQRIDEQSEYHPEYRAGLRDTTKMTFSNWLLRNQVPFTHPFDHTNSGKWHPLYTCRYQMPENRKSQFMYLRPDLGTRVFKYENVAALYDRLGIVGSITDEMHRTDSTPVPPLTRKAWDYVERCFHWEYTHHYARPRARWDGPFAKR